MRIIVNANDAHRSSYEFYCSGYRYDNGFLVMTDGVDSRNNPFDNLPDEISIPAANINTALVFKSSVSRQAYMHVEEYAHMRPSG